MAGIEPAARFRQSTKFSGLAAADNPGAGKVTVGIARPHTG